MGPENAVRVVRAQTVPAQGFTLVTDNRLYIHGDVNVRNDSSVISGTFATSQDIGGKVSFVADSLTIMSERFDERTHQAANASTTRAMHSFHRDPTAYEASAWTSTAIAPADRARAIPYSSSSSNMGGSANLCTAVINEIPFETRINASLLMGDVPPCNDTSDDIGNTSGGVNNFPRFVERWSGNTSVDLVINGSMVGLFRSERGNARFLAAETDNGTIRVKRSGNPYPDAGTKNICDYRPPNRKWTFDQVLLSGIDKLPPGTPRVVANDRLRWVRR